MTKCIICGKPCDSGESLCDECKARLQEKEKRIELNNQNNKPGDVEKSNNIIISKKTLFIIIAVVIIVIISVVVMLLKQKESNITRTTEIENVDNSAVNKEPEPDEVEVLEKTENEQIEIQMEWNRESESNNELFNLDFMLLSRDGNDILNWNGNRGYSKNGELICTYTRDIVKNKGIIKILLFDTEGTYLLEGRDADFEVSNWTNEISAINAKATIVDSNGKKYVSYSTDDLYRSYTDVWFWGICTIDAGNIMKYDASWMEKEKENYNVTDSQTFYEDEVSEYYPFYGVWVSATKNESEAEKMCNELIAQGFDARIIVTSEWSNLNPETYYAISIGMYSNKSDAKTQLTEMKRNGYESAYIKYSGSYLLD